MLCLPPPPAPEEPNYRRSELCSQCKALTPRGHTSQSRKDEVVHLPPSCPQPSSKPLKVCLWGQNLSSESPGQSKRRFLFSTQNSLGWGS